MSKNENKMSLLLKIEIIFLLVVIVICGCAVVTKSNEFVVVKEFGSIKHIYSEPGINFKTPFIQSTSSIPKEIRLYDLAPSNVITSDKKSMIVDSYVLWKVVDPQLFIQTLSASTTNAESRIDTIIYNATKNTISNMTQDEVIQSRDGKIEVIENEETDIELNDLIVDDEETEEVEIMFLSDILMKNISESIKQYGIEFVRVDVKMLDLPDSNKESVYTRMISERANISATYEAQGLSEKQIIKNETDKEVSILLSEANAKAEQLKAEGDAEYMSILSEAYNDETKADYYRFIRSLDALKASMTGDEKTVILSSDSPIAQIFNMQ